MPHLNVSETEVQPGQRVVATFRLDVETPDDPGRYAPAVLERPSRHRSAEVGVWLAASPPFVVEDEEIRTVRVDPAEPRTESVTYALRATRDLPADVESASLIAVVTQKGRARGFVERAFEVVRMGVAWVLRPSPRRDAFAPFESVVGELEPDLTVFVRAVDAGFRDFKCLVRTPHISRYERGVEGDWHLPDRSRVVVERYMRDFTEAVTEFARRAALLGAGHELFRASPEVFKEVFWALVNGGTRIATIFVVSEEPHVPWELMVPNRVGSGGREHRQPLGVEFAIGRWTARPWGPPPTRLRIRRGLVVAPTNPCLQNGAAEATYVANLFNGTSLVPASIEQLDRVLESSSYDLLHFVCHGLTEQEIALQEVCLESNERLAPYFLQALSGVCTGLARDEPLVFLNACDVGRTNPSLVDAGGFPASLLNLRAGSVIAPLWSVTDATAFDLARDFYDTAVGDPTAPLGEIMARIRRRAYENHPFDDTFAAYAYYGDPLARLTTS
jgi:hypothetical protein